MCVRVCVSYEYIYTHIYIYRIICVCVYMRIHIYDCAVPHSPHSFWPDCALHSACLRKVLLNTWSASIALDGKRKLQQ